MKRIERQCARAAAQVLARRAQAVILTLICLVGAAAYSNTFRAPFVFDDDVTLLRNPYVRVESLNIADLSDAAFKGPSRSRPLTGLSFALNYYWGRYEVAGYHLVNLGVHLVNALLVYLLALAVFRRLWDPGQGAPAGTPAVRSILMPELTAGCAALIFVAHPIQTQAVTYISQRYASMAALFYLASVLCFIRARSRRAGDGPRAAALLRGCFFSLSIACGALAVMCKQSAATLPGAILLVEYFLFDRSWKGWKKKLLWGIPLAAGLAAAGLYLRGFFAGGVSIGELLEDVSEELRETSRVSRWNYLCTQFNVIVSYLRLLVLPVGQSLDHRHSFSSGFWDGNTPYAFLSLLAVLGAGFRLRRKHPALTFGVFWFFIALSVESSIFPIRDAMFEHRLYLPLVGVAMAAAYLVFAVPGRFRRAAPVAALVIVGLLAAATFARNRVWNDPVALWADAVAKNAVNARAYSNLGLALYRQGRFREAVGNYRRAIEIAPKHPTILTSTAAALIGAGEFDAAVLMLEKVAKARPHDASVHFYMGVALWKMGRFAEAEAHLAETLAKRPDDPKVHYHYGYVLSQLGELDRAAQHFERVLQEAPDDTDALYSLAAVAFKQGRFEDAGRYLGDLARKQPDNARAHFDLGYISSRMERPEAAVAHYSEALRLEPENVDAHFNLAQVLDHLGRSREAAEHYAAVLRALPGDTRAKDGLDRALANPQLASGIKR